MACEKPLARTLAEAEAMAEAATQAAGRTLVADGAIGRVLHARAAYLQSWGGVDTPLLWRFQHDVAGSGAHGDLNAHIIDTVRFVTGEEIATGGGLASFEATRLATGYANANRFEIHGQSGALRFDFERMNELGFYNGAIGGDVQGWTTIDVTRAGDGHPYAEAWWPDGHGPGYEHTFINQAADILEALGGRPPVAPLPDFADALRTQQVLHAALESARHRTPVAVADVRAVASTP